MTLCYDVIKITFLSSLISLSLSQYIYTHKRLQSLVPKYNLIIASYDIVRNDIDFFKYVNITSYM